MEPMKNIYNLLSDAFDSMSSEGVETDYTIDVHYNYIPNPEYTITIKSRNPNRIGTASLQLFLDRNGCLIDMDATNDLFVNDNWYCFCDVIECQIYYPTQIQEILQSIETNLDG